jgi:hypothetical protein
VCSGKGGREGGREGGSQGGLGREGFVCGGMEGGRSTLGGDEGRRHARRAGGGMKGSGGCHCGKGLGEYVEPANAFPSKSVIRSGLSPAICLFAYVMRQSIDLLFHNMNRNLTHLASPSVLIHIVGQTTRLSTVAYVSICQELEIRAATHGLYSDAITDA